MLNKVILIGRLVANLELKKTNDNIPYSYFTLAVNRQVNNDKTDFISCVVWRSTAELMQKYLIKGSLISIEGRLEVFRLEKNGTFEIRTNVNVQSVYFLDRRGSVQETKFDTKSTNVDMTQESPISEESFNDIEFDSVKF